MVVSVAFSFKAMNRFQVLDVVFFMQSTLCASVHVYIGVAVSLRLLSKITP